MDRFPYSLTNPNFVSPWRKEEMEAEREREQEEIQSEDTPEPVATPHSPHALPPRSDD